MLTVRRSRHRVSFPTIAASTGSSVWRLAGITCVRHRSPSLTATRPRRLDWSALVISRPFSSPAQPISSSDSADVTGIDIRVQSSATYALVGTVLEGSGAGAENAWVSAVRDDREVSANSQTHEGRFALKGLTSGRYLVRATIGGPETPEDRRPAREPEAAEAFVVIDASDRRQCGADARERVAHLRPYRLRGRASTAAEPAATLCGVVEACGSLDGFP